MLKFFRLPFATTGDKTAVPDAVDTNGDVSYSQGYGFDYQRQKTDPAAKNIERDKMNQIFFDVTTAIAELQANGIPDFITTELNGGTAYSYAQYAVVNYSGDLYISLVAANTALPSDATKWALLPTPARIQAAFNSSAVAAGTANDALTAAFSPAIAALPAAPGTLSVLVRAGSANTTATPTFAADATAAKTIVKGNNLPLVAGDIAGAGHWLDLQYDATLNKWVLQNPATGVAGVTAANLQTQTYTAFTTGGVSGTFTLTPSPALASYAAGQRFRVKFSAIGNGSDTINVSGLGAKNLKQYDATGSKAAPVIASGGLFDIEYDGVDFVILDPLPISSASTAEARAWVDNTKAITPLRLKESLQGANQSLLTSGYQKLPGGLIIQWGNVTTVTGVISVTFPLAFPNACLNIMATSKFNPTNASPNAYAYLTTGFSLTKVNASSAYTAEPCAWLAIGY